MSSFTNSPNLKIVDGASRVVLDSSVKHCVLAPPANDISLTLSRAWPDVTKGWLYNWRWALTYTGVAGQGGGNKYNYFEVGTSYITALAQEWSAQEAVATLPAGGINWARAMVRLNRTGNPSHTWNGQPLSPLVPINEWIPIDGSLLLEGGLGFVRSMSLYVVPGANPATDASTLVLHRQQSVSTGTGFDDTSGAPHHVMNYQYPASPPTAQTSLQGGQWSYGGSPGIVVIDPLASGNPATNPQVVTSDFDISYPSVLPNEMQRTSNNALVGAQAVTVTDPTNYSSTYQIEIAAKFGRIG